jgi:hypothetical protein
MCALSESRCEYRHPELHSHSSEAPGHWDALRRPSIHPSMYATMNPSIHIHQSILPSIHPSIHPCIIILPSIHAYPSTHQSIIINPPVHLCISIHPSIHNHPPTSPSMHIHLSIHPSIHLCIFIHPSIHASSYMRVEERLRMWQMQPRSSKTSDTRSKGRHEEKERG